RAPLIPAGRARPWAPQTERVSRAAAREAEGAALLRGAGAPVPRLLREGLAPAGDHGREPARAARVPARQRARAPRLRGLAAAGAPAHPPRPLDVERPPRGHPELSGTPGRGDRNQGRNPRDSCGQGRDRADGTDTSVAPSRPSVAHGEVAAQAGEARGCGSGAGAAHRRAVLEVTEPLRGLERSSPAHNAAPTYRRRTPKRR